MDKFDISILEYLGKVENGVLVLIAITYQESYFEATFFYNETDILLTIPENLEEITGDITKHPKYKDILKDILKKIIPFNEIYDRIDTVDFGRWVKGIIEIENPQAEEVSESEIKKDTE
jgi:hypothetical protein